MLPLLRTLASLVPAAVEGVVRDVTLLQVGGGQDAASIADEAGCGFVQGQDFAAALDRSVAGARSAWILLLRAGAVPERGFGEEVAAAFDAAAARPALILRERTVGLGRWWRAFAPVAGIIAARERLSGGQSRSFADAVRRAGAARDLPSTAPVLR